jgi:hypothetical protein
MYLRLFLILTLLKISVFSKAQNLHEFHEGMDLPRGWKSELVISGTLGPFDPLGIISIHSRNRLVQLSIFKKELFYDSVFRASISESAARSSCNGFSSSDYYNGASILTKDFFIVPRLCPVCDFEKDRKCKKLAKYLWRWKIELLKAASAQNKANVLFN